MDRNMTDVKTPRAYNGSGRRKSAASTRERVLDVAERLFLADGFSATTVAAIAEASEVSVETVYKAYGNKTGVLAALRSRALSGSGRVPAEERSDSMRESADSPRAIIANWASLQIEVMPRVAPILLLVRDASASAAEARQLHDLVKADRMKRMLHHSTFLHAAGFLRPGLSVQQAADVLYAYTAPELYQILVLDQAWSLEDYRSFVVTGLMTALLG
jgi:AcrR family transcriptional regulator